MNNQGDSRDFVQSYARIASCMESMDKNYKAVRHALEKLNTMVEKRYFQMAAELWQIDQENEVVQQKIKQLEQEIEEEEARQWQRKQMAAERKAMLPEVVKAQMVRELRARRRGFVYWLQTLCLLCVCLLLAVSFALAAGVLYASWYDPELFYRLLLRLLSQEAYVKLSYRLGKLLPVVSEGLLPS